MSLRVRANFAHVADRSGDEKTQLSETASLEARSFIDIVAKVS